MNAQGFVLMPIKNHQCGFNNMGLCRSELHIQSNPLITPRIIITLCLQNNCIILHQAVSDLISICAKQPNF